ncbi:hypothetical protein PVAP13_3NG200304 [Panicum virgatum]|uniref:TTF-type domain-containing protein n=1 Tax=Panicum virgatum TaxID=38727 RepID=A0A8T0UEP1_PANVG|nr:hypothetical protein PVAP13_3NG200304 [Panicum virgatum]
MERYFKRKASCPAEDEINWDEKIQYDPGLRKEIDSYHPNLREKVRRKYLENGPCQPRGINFPLLNIGEKDKQRRFMREWFDEFGPWLEYSEKTQRVYCFYCFLFREKKDAGYDVFVVNGWNGFHRKERLRSHMGEVGGLHYNAMKKCDDLLHRKQHIDVQYNQITEVAKRAYFTRLNGSIDTARLLLKQGLPFRGHDESKESYNRGNFKEFYDCLAEHDPILHKAVTTDATKNSCLLAPEIQRDIVECFANEIMQSILEELGGDVFSLLVDESRDVSCKEQMGVVLRYVDKCGIVKERFVGLVHVTETTSSHLKSSIDSLLAKFKISLKQCRGQGYDGASNMRGELNGLQSLILRDSKAAYYVHCFAHQLQLVIVATMRKHKGVSNFLNMISILLNVVGGSAKRRDMIRDINYEQVEKALGCGQLETGTGLNQEQCLQRPGDTRWSSQYKTLKSLVNMFPTIVEVLKVVEKDDRDWKNRDQASNLLVYFQSFDFVFYLHLLLTTLTATNTLSLALQCKDQDIVNAIGCVNSTRLHLHDLRRDGWDKLLDEVNEFCDLHEIDRVEMESTYIDPRQPRKKSGITNKHHYAVDCFNDIIDWLVQELDSRFSETTSQLLVCSAAFNPRESFQAFNGGEFDELSETVS